MIRSSLALTRQTGTTSTRHQRRQQRNIIVNQSNNSTVESSLLIPLDDSSIVETQQQFHHHDERTARTSGQQVFVGRSMSRRHTNFIPHHSQPQIGKGYFCNGGKSTIPAASLTSTVSPLTRTLSSMSTSMRTATSSISSLSPLLSSQLYNNYNHYNHHQQIRTKVFVSQHNDSLNISHDQILDVCGSHGIYDCKSTHTHVIVKECPFCPKPTNGKPSNHYKLYIKVGGGAYFCHRCGASGSWYDLKQNLNQGKNGHPQKITMTHVLGGNGSMEPTISSQYTPLPHYPQQQSRRPPPPPPHSYSQQQSQPPRRNGGAYNRQQQQHQHSSYTHPPSPYHSDDTSVKKPLPLPRKGLQGLYTQQLGIPVKIPKEENEESSASYLKENSPLEYLVKVRGLSLKTLKKYGVGSAKYNFPSDEPSKKGTYVSAECITFPWIMSSSDVAEQEALRDAVFEWTSQEKEKDDDDDVEEDDDDSDDEEEDEDDNTRGPPVVRRIKARAVQNKGWQRLDPPGGGWGLFGYHMIPHDKTDEIIITEGEYDAMAVYQATGRYAVSLPNGCRNLPLEVLPLIERFERVYLWMDNDRPGQEGAEKFAKKIGLNRCVIVSPSNLDANTIPPDQVNQDLPKDANEALLKGYDLNELLHTAQTVPHEQIAHASDYRFDIMEQHFNPEKYAGVAVPSLPSLTKIMKGFRRGEMTVLTGSTGSGKTTFLSQLSLDFAEQGINTLWGSFEVKNVQLMTKMMRQFHREPLPSKADDGFMERFNAIQDKFETLPLHFMKFHGSSDIDDVMDAMDYAVYVYDVQHIIIDNMQFMTQDNVNQANGKPTAHKFENKYDRQDYAIAQFRKFATDRKVHVTLVVHPKKVAEGEKLGIDSFYGGGKATQEADNVLVLQKDSRRKYIEVKKNRHDGTLGFAPLHFQQTTGRYAEVPMVGSGNGSQGGGSGASPQPHMPPPPAKATPAPAKKKQIQVASGAELENHWNNILHQGPPSSEN